MVLLMIGVFAGDGAARFVNWLCILLLVAVGACVVMLPAGRAVLFDGSFVVDDFARFLKMLMLTGSAGTLILSLDYLTSEKLQKAEYRRAGAAGDARHDGADLGVRPDRALSRPRTDEPAALRASPRRTATMCARPKRA